MLPVLLTVRGTLVPTSFDAARVLHNETAGSAPGMAAARALGDLSHKVFAPCTRDPKNEAKAGELLFLDIWQDAQGIGQFFGNPHVQEQAQRLFSKKDASVWMPARGAYTYALPAPRDSKERYVGIVRGQVASPEATIEIFAKAGEAAVRDKRLRGIISHELFVRLGAPGEPVEVLGLDIWSSFDGMVEHYGDTSHMSRLAGAFSGRPTTGVFETAPGSWNEW